MGGSTVGVRAPPPSTWKAIQKTPGGPTKAAPAGPRSEDSRISPHLPLPARAKLG